jgi:hypothetical protein
MRLKIGEEGEGKKNILVKYQVRVLTPYRKINQSKKEQRKALQMLQRSCSCNYSPGLQ